MSDRPSTAPPRNSRFSGNVSSVVKLVLMAVIVIALNYLSCRHYGRTDLTELKSYTLSDQTEKVLSSELFKGRDQPVKIILAFRRSHPFQSRLKTVLEEYRRKSDGGIKIEYVDPFRNPDRAEELSTQYRIEFDRDLLIVDGRFKEEPIFKEVRTESSEGTFDLDPQQQTQLALSARVRFLEPEDLALFTTNSKTGRDLEAYQDEDAITSAILGTTEGTVRRIYYLSDKSQTVESASESPWKVLAGNLFDQNIALVPLRISEISEIPENADGVALIAPKFDLDERELGILRSYWERKGASLLMLLKPGQRPDRLRTFLREHGITVRDDRVIAQLDGSTITSVRATFTPGPEINSALAGQSTTFEGSSSSLEIRENAADLASRRIAAVPLISANPQFWGETNYAEASIQFDPDTDIAPPIYLAGAVIKGNANDDDLADDIQKMIVLSTTDFLREGSVREENVNFMNAAANWLLGREDLIGIAPKQLTTRRMTFLTSEISFINRITLFLAPLLALAVAAFVWNARRR